jgi:hypothetical protein
MRMDSRLFRIRQSRCASRAASLAIVLLALACVSGPADAAKRAAPARDERVPQYFPPIAAPPLDPPLRLTGTFGEYRGGHFHAGLDFSTGEEVGKPVYASLAGYLTRVRTSGVGYGRSIYLQADDGRLLVYGHLSAFDEPLASYVAGVHDSNGVYEQDLWLDSKRFRVTPGQRIGWSGRSGTGPPHLHFEIRRGDVAYNPLLAGVKVEDKVAPRIGRVVLEPLDNRSVTRIEGSSGYRFALSGKARLVVEALDQRANGRWTMAPWRTSIEFGSTRVECRFDSVSWAEGMSEVDYVYDRGRAVPDGQYAIDLYAGAGFRPRVDVTGVPDSLAAGLFDSDSMRMDGPVHITVRDAAGNVVHAEGRVRPNRSLSTGRAAVWPGFPAAANAPIDFDVIPETPMAGQIGGFEFTFQGGASFEKVHLRCDTLRADTAHTTLERVSSLYALWPALTPLRSNFRASILLPGNRPRGHVALYRDSGDGWEWVGAEFDSLTRKVAGTTRKLGRFALFDDLDAPAIALVTPARVAPPSPYPAWTLEATLEEGGSGVDARASTLMVDGHRVPSEWDAEKSTLRWTPLHMPAPGNHPVEVVATDRAGNLARRSGAFVID